MPVLLHICAPEPGPAEAAGEEEQKMGPTMPQSGARIQGADGLPVSTWWRARVTGQDLSLSLHNGSPRLVFGRVEGGCMRGPHP